MIWSTLCMYPGNPKVISEWLARGQNAPLSVIAEFSDAYEHGPCRYEDTPAAILADTDDLEVCPRHEAVLSLDQLLPHRSRISDLDISIHSSDPDWYGNDRGGEPMLLYHDFFEGALPNLQRLDFCAALVEQTGFTIPIPDSLFAGRLPRLKELKYLGVNGGLTKTVKDLVSCEIGAWSSSDGSIIISPEVLRMLFDNNKSVKSLIIYHCKVFGPNRRVTTATSMTHLKLLKIRSYFRHDLEAILSYMHVPQFKNLNTVRLSLRACYVDVVATDGSGHTFEFIQSISDDLDFYPLRHLGAHITTLRLDRRATQHYPGTGLEGFFRSLDAVQVPEFNGETAPVSNVLSIAGVFPALRVIRVLVCRDGCERSLQLLTTVLRMRMAEGNPLTRVEPLFVKDDDGLGCAGWARHYEAEGIQNFLSK